MRSHSQIEFLQVAYALLRDQPSLDGTWRQVRRIYAKLPALHAPPSSRRQRSRSRSRVEILLHRHSLRVTGVEPGEARAGVTLLSPRDADGPVEATAGRVGDDGVGVEGLHARSRESMALWKRLVAEARQR